MSGSCDYKLMTMVYGLMWYCVLIFYIFNYYLVQPTSAKLDEY